MFSIARKKKFKEKCQISVYTWFKNILAKNIKITCYDKTKCGIKFGNLINNKNFYEVSNMLLISMLHWCICPNMINLCMLIIKFFKKSKCICYKGMCVLAMRKSVRRKRRLETKHLTKMEQHTNEKVKCL
jgi:hypothetical protein